MSDECGQAMTLTQGLLVMGIGAVFIVALVLLFADMARRAFEGNDE